LICFTSLSNLRSLGKLKVMGKFQQGETPQPIDTGIHFSLEAIEALSKAIDNTRGGGAPVVYTLSRYQAIQFRAL
jgi:hypothetical protein